MVYFLVKNPIVLNRGHNESLPPKSIRRSLSPSPTQENAPARSNWTGEVLEYNSTAFTLPPARRRELASIQLLARAVPIAIVPAIPLQVNLITPYSFFKTRMQIEYFLHHRRSVQQVVPSNNLTKVPYKNVGQLDEVPVVVGGADDEDEADDEDDLDADDDEEDEDEDEELDDEDLDYDWKEVDDDDEEEEDDEEDE